MKPLITAAMLTALTLTLPGCISMQPDSPISATRSLKDVNATRAIKARMYRVEGFDLNDISVDVINGVVLLAGTAPTAEDKLEAERIAWSAPNVIQVGNEITVGDSHNFGTKTKDEFVSTAVRTRLAASSDIRSLNYNIETRDGVVYLMGVASNEAELKEAARLASVTRGVEAVVSYVTLPGQMPNHYGQSSPPSVVAQGSPLTSSPMTAPSIGDDMSYWGEPVSGPIPDTAPPSSNGAQPYSAPIDPSAPIPFNPNQTDLDPDALDSGEPIYRDPVTKERIFLPPGTKVIPYTPDDGAGSLGAGGTPPPGYARNSYESGPSGIMQATTMTAILPDNTQRIINVVRRVPQNRIAGPALAGAAPVVLSDPAELNASAIRPYTTPQTTVRTYGTGYQSAPAQTNTQPEVVWDGSKWVVAE